MSRLWLLGLLALAGCGPQGLAWLGTGLVIEELFDPEPVDGEDGADGLPGEQGPQGEQGEPGLPGPPGATPPPIIIRPPPVVIVLPPPDDDELLPDDDDDGPPFGHAYGRDPGHHKPEKKP